MTRQHRTMVRRLIAVCLFGLGIWLSFQIPEWTWLLIVYAVAWFGVVIYLLVVPAGVGGILFHRRGFDGGNGGNGNGGGGNGGNGGGNGG